MKLLKQGFLTGLGLVLPLVMTFFIVRFFIQLLTHPFEGLMQLALEQFGVSPETLIQIKTAQWLHYASQLLILLLLASITMFVGVIARWVFVHEFFLFSDWLFHRIPLMNRLYKAVKKAMSALFHEESQKFTQAVLVPFPGLHSFSIGLIASDALPIGSDSDLQKQVAVFIPGTPNPMQGFLLLYRLEQLVVLPISIEDALKCVVSCGVILPNSEEKTDAK